MYTNHAELAIFDFNYWGSTLPWKRRNRIQDLFFSLSYFENCIFLLESPLMSWLGVTTTLKLYVGITENGKLLAFIFEISVEFDEILAVFHLLGEFYKRIVVLDGRKHKELFVLCRNEIPFNFVGPLFQDSTLARINLKQGNLDWLGVCVIHVVGGCQY